MTQLSKIAKHLNSKNARKSPGVSMNQLKSWTGISRSSIAKRIYDLREEGNKIYTNFRLNKSGEKVTYYRLVA